jgi:hypothetical protein
MERLMKAVNGQAGVRTDLSSSLKVVEMHTWSSDWKRVIIIIVNVIGQSKRQAKGYETEREGGRAKKTLRVWAERNKLSEKHIVIHA